VSIITAWQCISPEMSVKRIIKRCISIVVDGTDDDILWDGSEEEGNVSSVGEGDEDGESGTDW
jgi:hypothetical protein